MAIYYFTNAGEPATPFEETGEDLMKKGLAIKATVPDGIESWRLSYDTAAKAVVVYADGQDEAGALAQQQTDVAAQKVTDDAKDIADREA
tara:strand:+ start:3021 stop:3290 length:270 start_codon:yes stop_codon:yes gene_type:complete